MQQAEKDLLDEKFKGIIAMITTNNDISKIYHKELLESQERILKQVLITNGRVTLLETQTKTIRFFEGKPIFFFLILLGIIFLSSFLDLTDLIKLF